MPATRDGKVRLWLVALLAALLAIAGGWWWQVRRATPPLPTVPLDGVDEQVAEILRVAMRRAEAEPRSGAAWGQLGKLLLAHGYLNQALECFANAERFEPDEPAHPYLLGALHATTDPDRAEECFRRAQKLLDKGRSRDQIVRLRLAELLLADDRLDQAEEELDNAERRAEDPRQRQRARFNRGLIAIRRGQWQRAFDLLTPLARDETLRGLVAAHLAPVCEQVGKGDLARVYSEQAVAKEERSPWPDRYLDECAALRVGRDGLFGRLRNEEKHNNAAGPLRELEALARQGSRDSAVYLSLGGLYYRRGEQDKADKALRQAIALSPEQFRPRHLLSAVVFARAEQAQQAGDAALARARFEEALEAVRAALALSPKDADGLLQRSRCERALGRNKEALATLREAVAIRPEAARVQMMLGEVLDALGEPGQALAHLERAVKLARNDPQPAEALKRFKDKKK